MLGKFGTRVIKLWQSKKAKASLPSDPSKNRFILAILKPVYLRRDPSLKLLLLVNCTWLLQRQRCGYNLPDSGKIQRFCPASVHFRSFSQFFKKASLKENLHRETKTIITPSLSCSFQPNRQDYSDFWIRNSEY